MIKNQKNKYAMYDGVTAYLDNSASKYAGNEEFISHLESFKTLNEKIALREDERNKATTGKTINKKNNRETVTNEALAVAGALYAYAKKNGMTTFMESVKFNLSKFNDFRDNVLLIELNSIKEKAAEYSEAISKYGITAERLNEFIQSIESYSNALNAKAAGGSLKTGASKSMTTLFGEADSILDSIDRLMENYKMSDENFYQGYKASRVIKDLGVRHKTGTDSQTEPTNS